MQRTYANAYLHFSPIAQRKFARADVATCAAAMVDIYATLKLHPHESPYAGKLYAELDAVRERLSKIAKIGGAA